MRIRTQTWSPPSANPMLGQVGTPQDMANTITFLLSPATSWVTGAIWNVYGRRFALVDYVP
jgi:NAD(P)-dependent dehydrogenase (short-subunit alcohol dehydrogenase family)